MLQSIALPAPLMLQPAARRIANLHAGVCSQRSAGHAWMQPSPRSAPSTVVHARLPHMDEELEHMQWQLDKRTHDGPAGTNANHSGSSRHSTKTKRRLVFHERHTGKERERNHSRAHRVQQQRHLDPSSSGSSSADATGSSSCDEATVAAAEAAARGEYGVLDQQQQQARQQDEQFYCLHLDHAAAAQDLHKTQDRLAKHIQEDGGCCVSAGVGQASLLTQLLLLLQHKQLHRKASKWGSDTVLLLQPLSCEPLPDDSNNTSTAAVAVAAASLQDTAVGVSAAAGQHGMSTVVRSGTGAHHLSCACPVDELQFFATFMPLHALLSVEHGSSAAAAAVLPGEIPDSAVGISAAGRAASLRSWSAAESSTEDAAAASTTSSSSSSKHARQNKSTVELLRAASSSSGGVAAVLLDAAERGHLRCVHVGLHADAATTAASLVGAVAAGDVLALHVKQNGAAHAVAFSALELTSRMLHSSTQQQQGFGVLLVPGHSHEHVHARTHGHGHGHGHVHGSAAPMDMHQQGAGSAAAAAAAAVQEAQHGHHQHHGKVADVSMDVGGIGAAFYGLGGWGDRGGQQQQQGVSHKHGQEVWLCVVPLGVGA